MSDKNTESLFRGHYTGDTERTVWKWLCYSDKTPVPPGLGSSVTNSPPSPESMCFYSVTWDASMKVPNSMLPAATKESQLNGP